MSIKQLLFVLSITFCLFCIQVPCSESENERSNPDIREMIASAEKGSSLIKSGKGMLTIETVWETTNDRKSDIQDQYLTHPDSLFIPIRHSSVMYAFDGERFFRDEWFNVPHTVNDKTEEYIFHRLAALNSEYLKRLDLSDPAVRPTNTLPTAFIYPADDQQILTEKFDSPQFNSLNILGNPVSDILKGEGTYFGKPITNIKIEGEEAVDSDLCLKISGAIADSDPVFQAWLMKDHYYMPQKIVITSPNSRVVIETIFEPTSEGLLFPKMRIQQNYFLDPSTGMWILKLTRTVTIDDGFAVNIPVPDDQFDIAFPAGVTVSDQRYGKPR